MTMSDIPRRTLALWVNRGEGTSWNLQVVQADDQTPQDLTGLAIWMTAKLHLSDSDAAPTTIIRALGAGITSADLTQGLLTLSVSSANTLVYGLGVTTLAWSLAIKAPNDDPQYPFVGPFLVYGIATSAPPP